MTFIWPPMDDEVKAAVARQLDETISIYDRSGIIARFEDAFAARHNAQHPLLTSSGTAALFSGYYGLGVGPGDEVLVQDYTFFATAMPLFMLGACPVLVDVDQDGALNLEQAAALITPRTKAVVITHMWGHPQDTVRLRAFCDQHGLALIEDCSHAHGASRDGISVGELADVAAWSLQGKKVITAGEGGIMTTSHREVYERANLLGHFAKRAVTEVNPASPLYQYAETGLGLKLRSHPLGLAMAEVYLSRLDSWLAAKQDHATRLEEAIAGTPGVRILTPTGPDHVGTLYAFVIVVNPKEAGFSRDDLLEATRRHGCGEFEHCDSMRPLHRFPAFTAPISPVTTYDTPLIRADLSVSEALADGAVRINIPVDHTPASDTYTATAATALSAALAELSATMVGA
ncbi:aminotransferase class I/II-fold pyridoxal phosphate-dependent enzyme [Streptosporangium canum]|uniref:DegT/DnrJ/EryC1/StrS family aminotransferase n=1 Tax=Streptosporangium canum TaxID=324952 RepID=UPI0034332BC0